MHKINVQNMNVGDTFKLGNQSWVVVSIDLSNPCKTAIGDIVLRKARGKAQFVAPIRPSWNIESNCISSYPA